MRQWKILQQNNSAVAALCQALNCPHFLARVLLNRGVNTSEKAKNFVSRESSCLPSPFLFRTMQPIVERIGQAVRNGERITVYGDYDVDGITATSLLYEVIRDLGGVVDYYIPSRFTEGYGVNLDAIRKIAEGGTTLMITVDTGITAVGEVEEAKKMGIDVIITDHHECQSDLPDTWIINPKCPDSGYPFSELAGVGVVYKLACALDQTYGIEGGAERFLPYAAIGTVADIMPMKEENRYIVQRGLELLPQMKSVGLQCLLEQCVGDRPIDTSTIGFVVAPRINAAGRMGSAQIGVELLTTEDGHRAEELVDELCRENNNRQVTENRILDQAIEMIEKDPANKKRNAIVLWHPEWHNGVIGIVASRLKDRYGKPCILFTVNGELAKGSGRSVRPFNLFAALEELAPVLERFGGHMFAAGVLAKTENLEQFRDLFCQSVDTFLEQNEFDESVEVDCELYGEDLAVHKIRELEKLAPFGRENETPIFCLRNVDLLDVIPTANGNHLRLSLRCGSLRIAAFYFNKTIGEFCYRPGEKIDLVFEADINTYNGRQSVRLLVRDVHCCQRDFEFLAPEFRRIKARQTKADEIPSRDDAVAVYRFIQKQLANETKCLDRFTMPARILADYGYTISLSKVCYAMEILRELGVLEYRDSDMIATDLAIHKEMHVDFENASLLKQLRRKAGEIG